MRAYKIENWCNLGPRIIVHPHGLPPSWKENNLPPDIEDRARLHGELSRVVHLNMDTLEKIESFRLI
jgi:hypothetical protein